MDIEQAYQDAIDERYQEAEPSSAAWERASARQSAAKRRGAYLRALDKVIAENLREPRPRTRAEQEASALRRLEQSRALARDLPDQLVS